MGHPQQGRAPAWEPTPKQGQFLACDDFEVLYGGAAGGGKSDAMLIDAWCLQHDGPNKPAHRACIFRKSFPDLRDLIDRANDLYPRFLPGVKYNKTDRIFTTPAGAKVEFNYLDNESDRFKYRGRAWNYIGWEELTLWASDVPYLYLMTRLRSIDRTLPRYIRATTNPDGPGQAWVMQRWGISEDGGATLQEFERPFEELGPDGETFIEVPRMVRRRFIPALLEENPHLRGTGYREQFAELPPDDREALLKGRWTGNRVRGAYYQREMAEARQQGRITCVPHMRGTPVNTFWDLGYNDTTAIWFHQVHQAQNRFLMAYEASGELLDHYVELLQRLARDRGYVYGTHYLPHDAENGSLTSDSVLDMLGRLMPGSRFEVVPKVDHVHTGIQQTRAAFAQCWFDAEDCRDGLAALDAYRKRWNPKQEVFLDEPLHDRYSNYADAFRQFGQGFHSIRMGGVPNNRRRREPASWRTA